MSISIRVAVNGQAQAVEVGPEESAAEVLRDRLGLTGTKLVCGEGVCGACTVLLDGAPVVSCLTPATALDGSAVTTVEGFGPDLHPVQRAFIARDAMQCGYCTPGFVVEAIAFHDRWRAENDSEAPSTDEVVDALAGHLCRCGAYLEIVAAVRDACAGRFDSGDVPGPRVEAPDKVAGRAVYTADVRYEGQLEGVILRAPHAHARVRSIDLDPARAHPAVRAAVALVEDGAVVRYMGQEVAAVAAVDRRSAEEACRLIAVDYEPLPAVIGASAARADGAPVVYRGLRKRAPSAAEGPLAPACWRGNVHGPVSTFSKRRRRARRLIERARESGDPLLVEGRWRTDAQIHTPFEPHCCVASWDGDTLYVHVSTQAARKVAEEVAERFGLARDRVHLVAEHVGGGFGAKLKMTPETPAAIELARAAGAPVRVVLDRREELGFTGYRPGAEVDLELLVGRTGGVRAMRVRALGDTGVSVGTQIASMCRMIYPAPAKELRDYDIVSHLPPGAPFRGPGGPIACWALEQAIDEAARRLDEDPVGLRRRLDPNPLRRSLYAWADAHPLWNHRPTGPRTGRYRRGVGVAAANWMYWHQTDCQVEVGVEQGRLFVATGVQDMGTGIRSVLARSVADAFDLEPAQVEVRIGDTRLVAGPMSGGSRTTATLLPAALDAAERLRKQLAAEGLPEERLAESLAEAPDLSVVADRPPDVRSRSRAARAMAGTGLGGRFGVWLLRRSFKLGTGRGYTGAVHISEVEVDLRLGRVRVLRVAGGIAAGRMAAPDLARSQCEGGVIQGLGYALYEQRQLDPSSGLLLSAGLEDYRLPGIGDTPEIEIHFEERGFEHVPSGGVGMSELSTLGVAASIGNAVRDATGWRPYELPIRPDHVLAGVGE